MQSHPSDEGIPKPKIWGGVPSGPRFPGLKDFPEYRTFKPAVSQENWARCSPHGGRVCRMKRAQCETQDKALLHEFQDAVMKRGGRWCQMQKPSLSPRAHTTPESASAQSASRTAVGPYRLLGGPMTPLVLVLFSHRESHSVHPVGQALSLLHLCLGVGQMFSDGPLSARSATHTHSVMRLNSCILPPSGQQCSCV